MISIQPVTFDLQGGIQGSPLPTSDLRAADRRMSRRALLDGSVSIYDGGYSDGDRTMTVALRASRTTADRASELMRLYNRVVVSAEDGCYRAALQSVRYDPPVLSLTLWIETRLSE